MTPEIKNALMHIDHAIHEVEFESSEDEGAAEWLDHLQDVAEQLKENKITILEAQSSLGMDLSR